MQGKKKKSAMEMFFKEGDASHTFGTAKKNKKNNVF